MRSRRKSVRSPCQAPGQRGVLLDALNLNTVEIDVSHSLLLPWVWPTPRQQEAVIRMPQGQCTLPADDAGRILDRLAGLEQIIPLAKIQQALTATGRVNSRSCRLTH